MEQQEPVIITGDANGMKEVPKTFTNGFHATHVFLREMMSQTQARAEYGIN